MHHDRHNSVVASSKIMIRKKLPKTLSFDVERRRTLADVETARKKCVEPPPIRKEKMRYYPTKIKYVYDQYNEGLYLMTQSPDQSKHPVPYVMYKAIAKSKSWQRVDVAVCLTMTIVCFGFSTILFIGYFKVYPSSPYFLHAAIASLTLSILYCLNALLTTRQLQSGTIDFSNDNLFATISSKKGPLSVDTSYGNQSTIPETTNYGVIQNRDVQRHSDEPSHLTRPRITPENSSDENFRIELSETLKTMELSSDTDEKNQAKASGNSSGMWVYDPSGKREFYRNSNWSSTESNAAREQVSSRLNPDTTGLDARERYIKAKQYRDFWDQSGSMSWNRRQAYNAVNLNKIENFNEKFTASGHSSGSESEAKPENRLSSSSNVPENYKPSTQPYTRRPIIPAFSANSNNRRISESSGSESTTSWVRPETISKQPASILKRPSPKRGLEVEQRYEEEFRDVPSPSPPLPPPHGQNEGIEEGPPAPSTSHTARLQQDDDATYSVIISPRPYKPRYEYDHRVPPFSPIKGPREDPRSYQVHSPSGTGPIPRLLHPQMNTHDYEVGPASSTSSYEEVSREDSPECDKSTTLVFFRGRKSPIQGRVSGRDEDTLKTSTTESSQSSTIRLDDYDSKIYTQDDHEVQAALSTVVNFNTEPILPIAANIDSSREIEMRQRDNIQRTSSRVRKRTGFDVMIRPKSAQPKSEAPERSQESSYTHTTTQI